MSASPKPPAIFSSSASKRGEIAEWREALNNNQENVRKDAVKKIIAAMTVGKDVSSLFSDVVKCVQTNNIELKKLVYLYIMNYAKVEPDLAILAVSTFDSDSKHPNPLIRGLAVRTMGCIRVNKIIEYLAEPLRRSLKDKDPYVRKTAAVAIAKLFDLNSELAIEQGFVESLEELLTDENPMVVANAVATLSEISSTSPEVNVEFNEKTVKTLLAALNECTEWGQVFILDALANYDAKSENEANQIADRVVPRLAHSNSAVVLSACKVIIKTLGSIQNPAAAKQLSKKMAGPLVTLLNSEPEIQYVALRNIDLIVQKLPGVLEKDVKVFFCKYNDPIYVKLEKLEIMIKLVSERNIDTVLNEFKEYATEVDVEFVRKSVRAIGRCAIKLEKAAQRCINTLLELIETKVNYVVQEAIIVIKDIFRKYPNKYEMIIGTLCQNLDTLDEPEAKAAMIWIIGEYADRIENADELIELFTDAFHDESTQVQLQILTSTVKLFLQRPNEGQKVVQKVLKMATEESDNPDLRDRGYMYWRLLSSNAQAAKAIILAEKPVISDDSTNLPKQLLDDLIPHIATLASVYHKPPELFVPEYRKKRSTKTAIERQEREEERDEDIIQIEHQDEEVPEGAGADVPQGGLDSLDDILGMGVSPAATTTRPSPAPAAVSSVDDLLGFGTSAPVSQPRSQAPQVRRTVVLPASKGNGLEIAGAVVRRGGQVLYDMVLSNASGEAITGIAAKFNVNTFGIAPGGPFSVSGVNPGQQTESTLPLSVGVQAQYSPDKVSNVLQVAIRANGKVSYFQDKLNVTALLEEDGKMQSKLFLSTWQQIPEEQERTTSVQLSTANPEAITAKLEARNIFYIAKHNVDQNQTNYYYSAKLTFKGESVNLLFELVLNKGSTSSQLCTKTNQVQLVPLFEEDIKQILSE